MARKATVSYAGLSLGTPQAPAEAAPEQKATPVPEMWPERAGGRTLKEASTHLMLYLHPAAAKALKRYALDQNVRVHDLLIEAVENWFQTHGLKEQVRVNSVRRNPTKGRK